MFKARGGGSGPGPITRQRHAARRTRLQATAPSQLSRSWAALHAALCSGQCFFWHSRLQGHGWVGVDGWAGAVAARLHTATGKRVLEGGQRAHLQYSACLHAEHLRSAVDACLQPLHASCSFAVARKWRAAVRVTPSALTSAVVTRCSTRAAPAPPAAAAAAAAPAALARVSAPPPAGASRRPRAPRCQSCMCGGVGGGVAGGSTPAGLMGLAGWLAGSPRAAHR